jgi:hypothetical protein
VDLGELKAAMERLGITYTPRGETKSWSEVWQRRPRKGDKILDNCWIDNLVPDLGPLISVCRCWEHEGATSDVQVYNLDTCWHQLFVITLLAYGKALDALFITRKDGNVQNEVTMAQCVWHCTTILWHMAYSGMLRHHLAVLSKKNWLVVPIYDEGNVELFQKFTGFSLLEHHMKHSAAKGRLANIGDREDNNKNRNENEELNKFKHMKASTEAGLTFWQWIQNLVSQ